MIMRKLTKLNNTLKNLDGSDVLSEKNEPILHKVIIANMVAGGRSEDSVGSLRLAQKIYGSDGSLVIEEAEYNQLKEAIKQNNSATDLARGQILEWIEEVEEIKPSA
jgi:hypothetical protein